MKIDVISKALLGVVLALISPGPLVWGEEVLNVDWEFAPTDGPLERTYGAEGIPIFLQNIPMATLVNPTTTPVNPFPDTPSAIYLGKPKENTMVRIRLRPFLDDRPEKGWAEFELQAVHGKFAIVLGVIKKPWVAEDDWAYIDEERLVSIRFEVDAPVLVGNNVSLATEHFNIFQPNERYLFHLKWDLSGETPGLRFQINGDPVLNESGEEVVFPIKAGAFAKGYLGLALVSGNRDEPNAEMFLGRIRAGTP